MLTNQNKKGDYIMAREKETYRFELELILEHFNGKHIISFTEVQEYTGRSYNWCRQHLNIPRKGCTAVQLAFALSHLK